MGSVPQQSNAGSRNQSKNLTGPLDAIVEGDSDDLEGGDSEQPYDVLADVPLTDYNQSKQSRKGTLLGFLGGKGGKADRKRIIVHKESKIEYFEEGSWQETVLSLSWGHMYDGIK